MRRREFITLIGGAAAGWPLAARAQQPALPVVGWLSSGSAGDQAGWVAAFRKGLNEAGFIEGKKVTVDYRWAETRYDRLPALAADLVRRRVAVIVASGAVNGPLAVKAATATIPIVFVIGSDPVQHGLVASLNRPGGNVTGVTLFSSALISKRVELLRQLVPGITAIGLLVNPGNPNGEIETRELQALARAGGLTLHVVSASGEAELEPAFATFVQLRVDGFLISTDAFLGSRAVVDAAARHKLPAVWGNRDSVAAGGLLSYGTKTADTYRLGGTYTAEILKGKNPADLPVQLPTAFDLVINLKTAKTLGLTVPPSLLAIADEVIE
jgi:putative ABC transport system substrate-binding protein